ncbi:hypothetical protein EBR96_07210 [bacterium]|nr:hypothetical protein [bacterium]
MTKGYSAPRKVGVRGTKAPSWEPDQSLTVGLYLRVSTDRQANEGDSLEEQENELRKYCDYRNFQIHKLYIERGKSGGNTNRPEYQTLIRDIQSGKINAVIVKKLDRLSRSLMDFEQLMVLFQTHFVDFISLREQFDTTTAMGKAMLRIALVFAQLEREQTSERITDVMAYRASLGHYNGGRVPFGYHVMNKELVPNKKEQAVVQLIFSKFLETRSLSAVARFLNDSRIRNGKDQPWQDTFIQIILQNPVYIGQIKWKDAVYPGMHLPLVTNAAFDEVQAIFANSLVAKKRKKGGFLLQKRLICGNCQCPITTSFAYNRSKTRYQYYRCTSTMKAEIKTTTCTLKYIPKDELESQLFQSLHALIQREKMKPLQDKIMAHNQEIDHKTIELQTQIEKEEAQLSLIKSRRSGYLDALIANDFLSEERQLIRSQIQALEAEERQLQSRINHFRLELNQQEETRVHFDRFKAQLIHLLELFQQQEAAKLQRYLPQILLSVTCYSTQWTIQFASLPWPIEIPI